MVQGNLIIFRRTKSHHLYHGKIGIIIEINWHNPIFLNERLQSIQTYTVLINGDIIICAPENIVSINGYY